MDLVLCCMSIQLVPFYRVKDHNDAGPANGSTQRFLYKPWLHSDCDFFPLSNICGTAERTKKEVAEKELELLRQRQKEQEQVMEAQERSFRENIAKLQEKMESEKEMLLREQEKMLEHKLKVSVDGLGRARCWCSDSPGWEVLILSL